MITSTSNARIKRLVNLKKKRKLRDEESIFLVEGIRMFREVPLDKLKEVYVSESFYKKEKDTEISVIVNSNNICKGRHIMSKNDYLNNTLSKLKQEKDLILSKAVLPAIEEFKADLYRKIRQQSSEDDKDVGR